MSWNNKILLLSVFWMISCSTSTQDETARQEIIRPPLVNDFNSNKLIEVDQLKRLIDHDSIVIIDMRKPEEYATGHIPHAINIWRDDIQNNSPDYTGMIAEKYVIEKVLSEKGVRPDQFLVIYDDNAQCDAARLWWVLDFYGFTNVALLNGGLKAWMIHEGITTDNTRPQPSNFEFPTLQQTYEKYITLDTLLENIQAYQLIDARDEAEWSGKETKEGAFNKGRIPGGIHIDWMESVTKDQTFKSKKELEQLFASHGIKRDSPTVVYCHSGVRSSHTTFVLTELLGYKNIKNYDGSWVEWSYFHQPAERDSTEIGL